MENGFLWREPEKRNLSSLERIGFDSVATVWFSFHSSQFSLLATDNVRGQISEHIFAPNADYLTIIPRAQMGYESIAHEAEGRMGYWLRARAH